ncbi:hypothetical protein [Marinimicrococcus flavescens]|uniref:Uncharacterized protein n=1 Tax=Marinimicrococcus flavescens TaxID=3031815 RepID=A0AAP3V0M2_9PROT|nr:hypothetical protein [Marinimicrococcus flavescens]
MWDPFVHGGSGSEICCAPGDRVPLLAPATTAAPMRLGSIFPEKVGPVPVTRMVLRGRAAVFEAHVGTSGTMAARLVDCPPAATSVLVLWLTPEQLEHLRSQEAAEERRIVEIDAGRVEIEGVAVSTAWVPVGRSGALRGGKFPVRVAEVPTIGCVYPALTTRAALRYVHRRLGVEEPYDVFEQALADDAAYRAAVNARLHGEALPV